LYFDNGFGAGEAQREASIVLSRERQFGRERVELGDFRTTPRGRQRADGAGLALAAPVAENGRVKAFTAQNSADLPGVGGTVSFSQDAQLVLHGEGPAAGACGNFGRHGGRCRHNPRPAAFGCAGTGCRVEGYQWHGHDGEFLPHPQG
jgi:hypothetical protein